MFGRKSHSDTKKSASKILDTKKDTVTRLKHLRIVLETFDITDAKCFFEQYYSCIYFLFHDGFTNVEASLGQRASKAHREELDFMLFILEKILTLLPEMIHKRWQLHSISRIMKKLLHTGNSLKLRREGMRLFLLWYEILMDNATEECHRMFRSLIPRLGSASVISETCDLDLFTVRTFPNSKVSAPDVYPVLLPQAGDKQPENLAIWLLETLLYYMVSEVRKIEWTNQELHEYGFNFLFDKFKEYYLREIFVNFRVMSIYDPDLELPEKRIDTLYGSSVSVTTCQETVVKWFANYTMLNSKSVDSSPSVPPAAASASRFHTESGQLPDEALMSRNADDVATQTPREQLAPGSNASTLSAVSSGTEHDSAASSVGSNDENVGKGAEVVRSILYASRENVSILHEVFRQAFLLPFRNGSAVRRVVNVYKQWFQRDLTPIFMEESQHDATGARAVGDAEAFQSDVEQKTSHVGLHETNYSSMNSSDLRAGMQHVLQVFITNSANVFLLELQLPLHASGSDVSEFGRRLEEQVDICKRVLNIYRYVVMNVHMNKVTWEQLLRVLLKITSGVLTLEPPTNQEKSLSGRIAEPLFKTLIVTWIKANLNIVVSNSLWETFLKVLSSLTAWIQLIREWAKTMDMLTRVLARHVYSLDLHDLPLDKLSEQKVKKLRGNRANGGSMKMKDKTPGRAWLKQLYNDTAVMANVPQPTTGILATAVQSGLVGPRVASIRQRSRSGESSPACLSQLDLTSTIVAAPAVVGLAVGTMQRSSSDSSIRIDPEKVKGNSQLVAKWGSQEEILVSDVRCDEDAVSNHSASDEKFCNAGFTLSDHSGDAAAVGSDGDDMLVLKPNDRSSLTSADSQIPYQCIDTSAEDSSDVQFEQNASYSSRSDTEVLLQNSDAVSLNSSSEVNLMTTSESSTAVGNFPGDEQNDESLLRGVSVSSYPDIVQKGDTDDDEEDDVTMQSFDEQSTGDVGHDDANQDSLQTDMSETSGKLDAGSGARVSGSLSVLAGGTTCGWTPEVAVVMWHRLLGSLGNVNDIKDPNMHENVFEYLCDLVDVMIKLRDNQGVTKDNLSSPSPPEFVPPLLLIVPWLFQALSLPDEYKAGKLLAYRLLCTVTLRRPDLELSMDHLLRFYLAVHQGLWQSDQDVINVLVRHCKSKILSLSLPGASMLMLDLVHGADMVLSSSLKTAPRSDAYTLLGVLLCLSSDLQEIPVLETAVGQKLALVKCTDLKEQIVELLLKHAKKEAPGNARCIALSNIGLFLQSELSSGTLHPRMSDAVDILLNGVRLNDKSASQVASQVLNLLCDHLELLLNLCPEMPSRLLLDICDSVAYLLSSYKCSPSEGTSQVLVSVMFCLLEWCMKLPLSALTSLPPSGGKRTVLQKVFSVLSMASKLGTDSPTQNVLQADVAHSTGNSYEPAAEQPNAPSDKQGVVKRSAGIQDGTGTKVRAPRDDTVTVAAKVVMMHLRNYLGHFPMIAGATHVNSAVREHSDQYDDIADDLKQSLMLSADNMQFFVLNNFSLVTFIELPAGSKFVSDELTADVAALGKVCRVIVRDPVGKYSWDSVILHCPLHCQTGMHQLVSCPTVVNGTSGSVQENCAQCSSILNRKQFDFTDNDPLNTTLSFVGTTSPECIFYPGEPLNAPFHAPSSQISAQLENELADQMLAHSKEELKFTTENYTSACMQASPLQPPQTKKTTSVFHTCRQFLNDLGYMVWEKRKQFDLLRKSERLLRDLKNLDTQRCRETHKIAVIFVAEGQEDKASILSNVSGSHSFEEFVAALGWRVDLDCHLGFMGGLQRTDVTATYYATSAKEVIFHVSTQMPSDTEEDKLKKLKHLGNDEVHVVWSEHWREYRHGIIQTEFGDVLIIIYPIHNNTAFRVQIICKPEVPPFGPLFDGAVVSFIALPGLVRATAINAGNMIRMVKPHYRTFYEERFHYVDSLVQQHKLVTNFEQFSAQVFSPSLLSGEASSVAGITASSDKVQVVQLGKAAKDDPSMFHRKLSLGKQRKSSSRSVYMPAHSSTTPPSSPSFETKSKK